MNQNSFLISPPRGVNLKAMEKAVIAAETPPAADLIAGEERQQFLRHWRKARGITQTDIAQRAGTSQQHVGAIERGERGLTAHMAKRLAKALGITVMQLYFGPDAPSHDELTLLHKLRRLNDLDQSMVLTMVARFDPAKGAPGVPPDLTAFAADEGIDIGTFDRERWDDLDAFAERELAEYPEIGATSPERRSTTVASLYLIDLEDRKAGRAPNYSQFRLVIKGQVTSRRAQGLRRPQA
ncbi:helix-turn-helix transcriptional regulator [Ferrovibrio terrae]|uniref:helix-turn-helix domain-containing protein n=1 Tax=Ferrovibrio terrae TaxID=2594003 RepID=UPI0031380A77